MTTNFEVKSAPAQKALAIRENCAMNEIGPAIGRILPEVYGWAAAHGVTVVGPAFTRYLDWGDNGCVIEAGFVVDRAANVADPRVHDVEHWRR
jgi:hypothetical protein